MRYYRFWYKDGIIKIRSRYRYNKFIEFAKFLLETGWDDVEPFKRKFYFLKKRQND